MSFLFNFLIHVSLFITLLSPAVMADDKQSLDLRMDPFSHGENWQKVPEQNVDRYTIYCQKTVTLHRTDFNWVQNTALMSKILQIFFSSRIGYKIQSVDDYTRQFTIIKIGENEARIRLALETELKDFYSIVEGTFGKAYDEDDQSTPVVSGARNQSTSSSATECFDTKKLP